MWPHENMGSHYIKLLCHRLYELHKIYTLNHTIVPLNLSPPIFKNFAFIKFQIFIHLQIKAHFQSIFIM